MRVCGCVRARAGHCTWRAGDKAERSEVWVTGNESRAKRGVGYAMLVQIKMENKNAFYVTKKVKKDVEKKKF